MEEVLVYLSIIHNGEWNKIYQDILEKRPIDKNEIIETVKNHNISYITLLDKRYPTSLKTIFKPPFVIFYKGNIELLNSPKKKIAVIGSREHSEYGKKSTESICKDLSKENIIVVSGLAKGIDSIAHQATIDNNGSTIAVLGNGLNVIYPKENEMLYKEIEEKGLIISEYPLNVMPNSANFPKRNRIIAGISDGVLVIEAKEKSGTMNTVSHALEDGKQIFCVPERNFSNSGCNKLIKEGAKLVENCKDIIDELY
jgi:DNA processing protein